MFVTAYANRVRPVLSSYAVRWEAEAGRGAGLAKRKRRDRPTLGANREEVMSCAKEVDGAAARFRTSGSRPRAGGGASQKLSKYIPAQQRRAAPTRDREAAGNRHPACAKRGLRYGKPDARRAC